MTLTEDDEGKDKNTTITTLGPKISTTESITDTTNSTHHTNNSSSSMTPPPIDNSNLSPAVSAFQQFGSSSGRTSPSVLSTSPNDTLRNNNNQHMSPPVTKTSQDNPSFSGSFDSSSSTIAPSQLPVHIKDGYVYKDKVVILNQAKKDQLLKIGIILLQSEWTYWYDRYAPNLPASEYEANLQVISTVGTVQKFWSVYNNIDGPEKLGFRSNLHFMRKGIKPIWEDPKNEYGGSYNFKVSKHHSPLVWRDLLVVLIGEKIEQCLQDTVCGVSVSSRQHCDSYQIWVSSGQDKNDNGTAIKSTLADLLGPADIQSFYFKIHKNHAAFQKDGGPIKSHGSSNYNSLYTKYNKSPIVTRPASPPSPPQLTEMRQKITEENIEKVVADIERLGLKQKSIRKANSRNTIVSSS
ncbi:unnamed protein product [Absidia cylindrospora]